MTDTAGHIGAIILAAGKGTRMKSDKAKVLHEINGRPMACYVVGAAQQVAGNNVVVVIGHQAETVRQVIAGNCDRIIHFALQSEQLGTGHAVQCALPMVPDHVGDIVILCGDTPLITAATIERLAAEHTAAARDLTVLAVTLENPTGYGRLLIDERNRVTGIVEEADATAEQKQINIVNSGIYCTTRAFLSAALDRIDSDNAQGEFYLTDIMEIGHRAGKHVGAMVWGDHREVMGVNTLYELELAEKIMKTRTGKTS